MNEECSHITINKTGTGNATVVCISPLTAIMIEQQRKFLERGIRAEFVGLHSWILL